MTNVAEWVINLCSEDLPLAIRAQLKRAILDGLGAALAGTQTRTARIAARFVAEHPDSVVGLTLASIAKGHGRLSQSERQRLLAQRLDDVASLGPRGMAAKRGPRLLGREATEEMRHMVVETMARIRPEGYAQAARMLSAGDILADLARLPAGLPMQVIVGEADAITLPGACLEIAAAFAAPAHIISGAGHALYLEKAQEFNRLLSDFALARRD